MTRTGKLLTAPIFLFLAYFTWFASRHRFIDGDEGFYLLASRLVLQHKTPYLDFLYTQSPLLPYAYALWIKLFGVSWFSARTFSAGLTTVLGLLIYQHVSSETRRWTAGLVAVVLFVSSTFIFAWFPLVKTFSLASLFLFAAYVMVSRLSPTSAVWPIAVAGLLFGLSFEARSYVVGVAPVFLWWIFRQSEKQTRLMRIVWFLGGFTIGSVLSLGLFIASPDLFLFNNLGYHALRSDAGLIGGWRWKVHIARIVLLGAENNGIQFSILSVASLATILVLRVRRGAALLAFVIAVVLGFISILPTPPLVQYFCMCMPFLIVSAVCGASSYLASLRKPRAKQIAMLAGAALLSAFVASSLPSIRRYMFTGSDVIGIKDADDAPNWTLDQVSAVSQAIDRLAWPGEAVASFWPGYLFASHASCYPEFENDFAWMVTGRLTDEQRKKYHVTSRSDIEADFAAHTPRIVVLGNQEFFPGAPRVHACARILHDNGYTAEQTIGDASIFVCCSRP